jgi:hypothetical protein
MDLSNTSTDTNAVRQGLVIARTLVRRRFLDAFDKGGTEVLSKLMLDMSDVMAELDAEEDFMQFCVSTIRIAQHNEELLETA